MIKAHSIHLKNVVSFKEAIVPITKNNGLVIIRGHNKDSRSENQNNGAGKSLLFSTLPNVTYASSPTSTLRNTKKDMLGKKSEISFRFLNNEGVRVLIEQTCSKWRIFENDVDQEVHRLANQQEKIAHHFPITADEFYAYTYLSSIQGQRVHFQVDKPTERLKFLTSVFQLDSYDKLKKYFTNKLSDIKDEQIKFDVLDAKLLNVGVQLNKVDWSEEKAADYKKNKKLFKELKSLRTEINNNLSGVKQDIFVAKSIAKLGKKLRNLTEDFPDKPIDELKKSLSTKLKNITVYDTYKDRMVTYEKHIRKVRSQLEELTLPKAPSKNLKKKIKAYLDELEDVNEKLSEAKQVEKKFKHVSDTLGIMVHKLCNEFGYKDHKEVPDDDVRDELAVCETTLQLKKLIHNHDDHVCPTCLQDIDLVSIKKNVKKAKARVGELRDIMEAQALARNIEKTCKEKANMVTVDTEALRKKKTKLEEEKIDSCKEALKTIERHKELTEYLESIEKPERPKTVPKNKDKDIIEEALRDCNKAEHIQEQIDALIKENKPGFAKFIDEPDSLDELIKCETELDIELKALDKEFNALMRKVSAYDLQRGEHNILTKQKLELEKDLSGIKPLLEKRDIYKGLERAYSAKGLKINKANEILSLVETNLNKYSALIFAEPFHFSVYAKEQGIFCDVDRGKGRISDVRLLSGSESDCFKLLFLVSLLLLVSPERRANFVVLDEPDSHMDPVTRVLFAEQYLPFLRTVVPHTFLITPNEVDVYQDFELWTVVKEKGVSTLELN